MIQLKSVHFIVYGLQLNQKTKVSVLSITCFLYRVYPKEINFTPALKIFQPSGSHTKNKNKHSSLDQISDIRLFYLK